MRDVFARYTTAVISEAVYGLDAKVFDTTKEPEFVKFGKSFSSKLSISLMIKFIVVVVFPWLARKLKFSFNNRETFHFFFDISDRILADRKRNGTRGNDMLQLLQDVHDGKADLVKTNEAESQFEKDAKMDVKLNKADVMDDDAIRQGALLFFIGGFDTTALTLSTVAYYLALYPEIQDRARAEADSIEKEDDVDYEDIQKLEYIEAVAMESMRMSPVGFQTERVCTKDYTLSTGLHLPKGTRVQFLTAGLHRDPKYYSDPDKFDPERFNKENRNDVNPYTYLPFGTGPRNCIGMRFAMMEVKVAIFHLLRSFKLEPSSKTPIPIKYETKVMLTNIQEGNYIKLVPRT